MVFFDRLVFQLRKQLNGTPKPFHSRVQDHGDRQIATVFGKLSELSDELVDAVEQHLWHGVYPQRLGPIVFRLVLPRIQVKNRTHAIKLFVRRVEIRVRLLRHVEQQRRALHYVPFGVQLFEFVIVFLFTSTITTALLNGRRPRDGN